MLQWKCAAVNQENIYERKDMNLDTILTTIMIGSSVLMVISILLQQRGATLGAGFGSSGELYTTRRGIDKNLFEVTIVLAVIFILSILVGLLLPSAK